EQLEREQAAQPVGKAAGQAGQRLGLAIGGGLRPPAHERHEKRNERGADKEQEARYPIERQDDGAENERQQRRLGGSRQIAGKIAIERFDLIDQGGDRSAGIGLVVPARRAGKE